MCVPKADAADDHSGGLDLCFSQGFFSFERCCPHPLFRKLPEPGQEAPPNRQVRHRSPRSPLRKGSHRSHYHSTIGVVGVGGDAELGTTCLRCSNCAKVCLFIYQTRLKGRHGRHDWKIQKGTGRHFADGVAFVFSGHLFFFCPASRYRFWRGHGKITILAVMPPFLGLQLL